MDFEGERPISDYGLIGNSRTAALISSDGSMDWCCLPRFDSDPVFCSLLDPEIGGKFAITPSGPFQSSQAYIPETNVLVTRFETPDGITELSHCFTVTDEATKRLSLWPDHEVLRKLRCLKGSMKMRLLFYPTREFGLHGFNLEIRPKWGATARDRNLLLALQTDLPPDLVRLAQTIDGRSIAVADFNIHAGEVFWFSMIFEKDSPGVWPALGAKAEERLAQTIQYWRHWIDHCQYSGPYEKQVRRSALTLKLLSFAPSGAIIAAPTTSLPEWFGGTRNWDYRYCWLRDASFTVRVLISLGFLDEARSFVSWLLHSTKLTRKPIHPRLQVLYDIYGKTDIAEQTLPWLRGYRRSRPVRMGNAAIDQLQNDVYGEVVESLSLIAPFLGDIDRETRDLILETGLAAADLWEFPDEGMWETRKPPQHHTHSKALSWVALTRTADLARKYGWKTPCDFSLVANRVRASIESRGFNPEIGAYVSVLGGRELDASLLTLPMIGYCNASSVRFQSTVSTIQKELGRNGLIYRYRSENDGIGEPEGAFGICNFWMAEALFRAGKREEGKLWFDSLLRRSENGLGLWSEEINPATGEALGNYPQAFSHVGLISAAIACAQAERDQKEAA